MMINNDSYIQFTVFNGLFKCTLHALQQLDELLVIKVNACIQNFIVSMATVFSIATMPLFYYSFCDDAIGTRCCAMVLTQQVFVVLFCLTLEWLSSVSVLVKELLPYTQNSVWVFIPSLPVDSTSPFMLMKTLTSLSKSDY